MNLKVPDLWYCMLIGFHFWRILLTLSLPILFSCCIKSCRHRNELKLTLCSSCRFEVNHSEHTAHIAQEDSLNLALLLCYWVDLAAIVRHLIAWKFSKQSGPKISSRFSSFDTVMGCESFCIAFIHHCSSLIILWHSS